MNILQLCNKVPFPVVDGGTAAMHQLGGLLTEGDNTVKVIAAQTHKRRIEPSILPHDYLEQFRPEFIFLDTKVKWIDAFLSLFSKESYNITRFNSKVLHEKIKQFLQKNAVDVVILESLFMTPYINTFRDYSKAKIILRAHNIEHLIWERHAANEKNPLKKIYLKHLSSRLKNYELHAMNKVDAIAAISKTDESYFKQHTSVPVEFIPFVFDNKHPQEGTEIDATRLYFLGAMDWKPNLEAANWLLQNIVPLLKNELNKFQLTLGGFRMPEEILKMSHENFSAKGKVESPEIFISEFGTLLAPLFSGGGLKIKIIEAMSLGRLVVTTPVGAEGIGAENGQHLFICESKEDFIKTLKHISVHPEQARNVAKAGQDFLKKEFNRDSVKARLNALLKN